MHKYVQHAFAHELCNGPPWMCRYVHKQLTHLVINSTHAQVQKHTMVYKYTQDTWAKWQQLCLIFIAY